MRRLGLARSFVPLLSPYYECSHLILRANAGVYSGGADNKGYCYELQTQTRTQFAQHDQPIKAVRFLNKYQSDSRAEYVATGSWDARIHIWDVTKKGQPPIQTIGLPERLYSMDCQGEFLVAACADRRVEIYRLDGAQGLVEFNNYDPNNPRVRCPFLLLFRSKSNAVGSIGTRIVQKGQDLSTEKANPLRPDVH